MEPNEAHELQESHEHAVEHPTLRPASFTMSVLAVLVAVTTVMGHRIHTEAVLDQARASDQWNLYQAKKIRQSNTELAVDSLSAFSLRDNAAAQKLADTYKAHLDKWSSDLEQEQDQARDYEREVRKAERRATRFDLGEALLEIGLVVTSITLLTRQRSYWFLGMAFGAVGLVIALTGVLAH